MAAIEVRFNAYEFWYRQFRIEWFFVLTSSWGTCHDLLTAKVKECYVGRDILNSNITTWAIHYVPRLSHDFIERIRGACILPGFIRVACLSETSVQASTDFPWT